MTPGSPAEASQPLKTKIPQTSVPNSRRIPVPSLWFFAMSDSKSGISYRKSFGYAVSWTHSTLTSFQRPRQPCRGGFGGILLPVLECHCRNHAQNGTSHLLASTRVLLALVIVVLVATTMLHGYNCTSKIPGYGMYNVL